MSVIPVILSGGSGTRLWPLSRKQSPKQLLNLAGGAYTMLQETALRVSHLQNPIIVCNEDHRFMVAEQCHSLGIKPNSILLEPVGRNTAPAITLAALQALKEDSEAIIAVFPADHLIENQQAFEQSLNKAIDAAKENKLVTFGIVPNKPETGYGYIKANLNKDCGLRHTDESLGNVKKLESHLDTGSHLEHQNRDSEYYTGNPEHHGRHPELDARHPELDASHPELDARHPELDACHPELDSGSQTINSQTSLPVEKFVEKPNLATAQIYLDSGDYYWNSGMFVFKASAYLDALKKFNSEIVNCCQTAISKAKEDLDFIRIDKESFSQSPDDSIDYAVMEKSNNVVVVPMDAGWSDVGSWSSLWDVSDKDENNNAHIGDVIEINSNNNLVHSTDKLVATIGLENIVIVGTKDALLVANKDQVQDVKNIVSQLSAHNRTEHSLHREVQRPWGCYDSIDNGKRYQVKRITVKSGASLSLQMHHHRAEHWVVVSGTALVQVGEKEQLLSENESVYIPIGETHRLTNPGKLPLELIEVQSGSYLGEDDIVRFEDNFGRAESK